MGRHGAKKKKSDDGHEDNLLMRSNLLRNFMRLARQQLPQSSKNKGFDVKKKNRGRKKAGKKQTYIIPRGKWEQNDTILEPEESIEAEMKRSNQLDWRELKDCDMDEEEIRKNAILDSGKDDNKLIKFYEKKLGMMKEEGDDLPQSFYNDGLDFVLDAVEGGYEDEQDEGPESVPMENSKKPGKKETKTKKKDEDESDSEIDDEEVSEDDEEESSEDDEQESSEDESDTPEAKLSSSNGSQRKVQWKEDLTDVRHFKAKNPSNCFLTLKDEKKKMKKNKKTKLDDEDEEDTSLDDSTSTTTCFTALKADKKKKKKLKRGNEWIVEDIQTPNVEDAAPASNETWEDIYGRVRDKSGNVVTAESNSSSYVPLAKRFKVSEEAEERARGVSVEMNRLLNKVSQSNMLKIVREVEKLYMNNARNDLNEALFSFIQKAVIQPAVCLEHMVQVYTCVVATLHANIGTEVGAFFLQSIAKQFNHVFESKDDSKRLVNILMIICYLYHFGVVHSKLIVDIIKKLTDRFTEADIESLLLMLKNIGMELRKEDPASVKDIVVYIQKKAVETEVKYDKLRIKFMLDIVLAIKNNTFLKIPGYNPGPVKSFKSLLKALLHEGCSLSKLTVSLADLLQAESHGRWWIVGAPWAAKSGDEHTDSQAVPSDTTAQDRLQVQLPSGERGEMMVKLAKQHKMNSQCKKSIFYSLLLSQDFLEAYRRIECMNLRQAQITEMMSVILYCFLNQDTYNAFYVFLLVELCKNRIHAKQALYVLKDRLRRFDELTSKNRDLLRTLLTRLIINGTIPIIILQMIEIASLDAVKINFLRQIVLAILMDDSDSVVEKTFGKIPAGMHTQRFREGMLAFLAHFIIKDLKDLSLSETQRTKIKKQVKAVKKTLKRISKLFGENVDKSANDMDWDMDDDDNDM